MKHFAVLGDGAWGTACAQLLADNGHTVTLWCYNAEIAHTINAQSRNNVYLPNVVLSSLLHATTDIHEAINGADCVFEAIPVMHLRSVLAAINCIAIAHVPWVILSKGIEQKTLLLPTQIIADVIPHVGAMAVLFGPSFATELALKKLTAVSIASHDRQLLVALQEACNNDYFCTYPSSDCIGIQMCGAIKNSVALGIGLLDGIGSSDNTKAFFLTRALDEMALLVRAVGGQRETLYGLSGIGDLLLTTFGGHSKNLAFGRLLAKHCSLASLSAAVNVVPEGVNTTASIIELAHRYRLSLPLLSQINTILCDGASITSLLKALRNV